MESEIANGSSSTTQEKEETEEVANGALPSLLTQLASFMSDEEKELAELEKKLRQCVLFNTERCEGKSGSDRRNDDKAVILRDEENQVVYKMYQSELEMPDIMELITKDLSEPYSIYTYRYFIHNWPYLCMLAYSSDSPNPECVGAVVGKLEHHKYNVKRGYIAMLAVEQRFRRRHIGSLLVKMAIKAMQLAGCLEVFLETEVCNDAALNLYEKLGFVRDKRLFRYYLNGGDAYRLKLWL